MDYFKVKAMSKNNKNFIDVLALKEKISLGFSSDVDLGSQKQRILNKKIKEANLPEHIRIGAVVRKDKVIIPRSDFIFEKEDLVVLLAQREHLKEVEDIFSVSSI